MTDKELIGLCIKGDNKGYTMLYHRYAKSIYNSIRRLVQNTSEAEDLLQEVFVQVFSDSKRLTSIENFEAWTRRIAINSSISHLRKRRIFFTDIDDLKGCEITEDNREIAWEESRIEDVQEAINKLPNTAKTIVNLFLFENMSQEEIGKTIGMSHIAVRSQYHRAKAKIAQEVKKKNYHGR